MTEEPRYPDPGTTVRLRTGRHGFEYLDGRVAEVVSWDGERGVVLVSVPPTEGERARGELARRVEVERDELRPVDPDAGG